MIHPLVWCDGEIVPTGLATVPIVDRTVLYGLGAFETVRLHGGRPFRLDRHLARLERSLESVGLETPEMAGRLETGVVELARRLGVESCICRMTVTAGQSELDLPTGPRVLAFCRDVPHMPPGQLVRVGTVRSPERSDSPLVGVKSTSYLVHYLLWELAAQQGRIDDLLVDDRGMISEATVSNVFVVRDGRLLTPPVSEGLLPGITRETVLELAADCELPVAEEPLAREDLAHVDECFLTGAAKGVVPVDELDGRAMPTQRPVAEALQAALVALVAAELDVGVAAVRF